MIRKKIILTACVALSIVLGTGGFQSIKADSTAVDLTKEAAIEKALDNNLQKLKLYTAIDTITRNIKNYEQLSDEVEDMEEGFEEYKSAYKGLSASQKSLFTLYNTQGSAAVSTVLAGYGYPEAQIEAILGQFAKLNAAGLQLKAAKLVDDNLKPKELTEEQRYNTFAYPEQIPVVLAKNMYKKAQLQKQVIEAAVDVKINQAYDSILYADDGYNLTNALYNKQVKDLAETEAKYQAGQISEVEKNIDEMELKQSKLQLDNLYRQVQNGKMQLNQALATDLDTQYNFTDQKLTFKEPASYQEYLEDALANRAEIEAAKIDIDEKQTVFDLVETFFDKNDYEYVKAQQELAMAKEKQDEVMKNIEIEIQNSYLDVKQKQSAKLLADGKLQQATVQYNSVRASYDAGVMPVSMMWNVELAVNQAKMNQNKAIRDYNNALYALEQNSKIGTEYVMEGAE